MKVRFLSFLLIVLGTLPSFLVRAEVVDKVVAIVGDEIITSSDVDIFYKNNKEKKTRGEILEELVDEKLIQNEIKSLQIAVSSEELSQAIGSILAQNKTTPEALKTELAKKGVSYEQYKKQISQNVKKMKFLGQVIYPRIKVSEEEVEKYQKANPRLTSNEAKMNLYERRGQDELKRYLQEIRQKTYIDIIQ
ncbi:MAG: SurA N-terminal domain-containing protein [Deltaproteobacteria bacterium]|nr:SurA N-terminal domain-containing protein [Deltaproteobacteria bacterium]